MTTELDLLPSSADALRDPQPELTLERVRAQRGRAGALRVWSFAQRHPIVSVFLLAFAARSVCAIGVSVFGARTGLFSDDITYSQLAGQMAKGRTDLWDAYDHQLYRATATFLVPLTALYRIIGEHPVAGRLFVALFGSIAAAATYRIAREMMNTRWSLLAGAIVALLPSQVLFSSIVLKDALVWASLASLGVVSAMLARASGRRLAVLLVAAGVILFLLAHLRQHTLVVAAWALILASLVGSRPGRTPRLLGVLALFLIVPTIGGVGPGGFDLLREQPGTLDDKRRANAEGADTAFVTTTTVSTSSTTSAPVDQPSTTTGAGTSSSTTTTSVATDDDSGTISSDLAGLRRGVSVMLAEPAPWSATGNSRVDIARAEAAFAWWPLLALALAGVVASRRHLRVMVFPVIVATGVVIQYALSEGNVGTAYRHRGEIVWVVALLAALGAHAIVRTGLDWRARRSGVVA